MCVRPGLPCLRERERERERERDRERQMERERAREREREGVSPFKRKMPVKCGQEATLDAEKLKIQSCERECTTIA